MSRAKQIEALRDDRRRLLGHMQLTGEHNRQLLEDVRRLRQQVSALQSDANSWQAGYDKGRADGDRFAREERGRLRAESEQLSLLRDAHSELADAVNGALHAACMPANAKPAMLVDVVERLMLQVAKARQGRHAV